MFAISPWRLNLLAHAPLGDLQGFLPDGPKTATGQPRFVIVIALPSSATSSSNARHLALNSVALMTFDFMTGSLSSYISKWSSDHSGNGPLFPIVCHRRY